jgi:hypothetical protein
VDEKGVHLRKTFPHVQRETCNEIRNYFITPLFTCTSMTFRVVCSLQKLDKNLS